MNSIAINHIALNSTLKSRFITQDPIRDGINWYAYVGNNPLTWVDPTGLYDVAMHGGAAGAYQYFIGDPRDQGRNGMENYAEEFSRRLLKRENQFFRENFTYVRNKDIGEQIINCSRNLAASNWEKGYEFLNNQEDDGKFNITETNKENNLIGWSIGADAVANFLIESTSHFNTVIIDAAQTQYLSREHLATIKSKVNNLVIVDHAHDYMSGSWLSEHIGGGDRVFGTNWIESAGNYVYGNFGMMAGAVKGLFNTMREDDSLRAMQEMGIQYIRINNSHDQDINRVVDEVQRMQEDKSEVKRIIGE